MTLSPDITDHPARVLIVDDEPHNRQLLEVMLAPDGYRPPDRRQRRGSARDRGAAAARPHPARRHDARDGRLRGDRQDQGQPGDQEHPGHHHHGPGRSQRPDARAERRRGGLSQQARRSGRTVRAGEEPGAPEGVRRLLRQLQPRARAARANVDHDAVVDQRFRLRLRPGWAFRVRESTAARPVGHHARGGGGQEFLRPEISR